MTHPMKLIRPQFVPPLDENFRPAVLANHAYQEDVAKVAGAERLILAVERNDGGIGRLECHLFPSGHLRSPENFMYAERLLKFMLWQYGGWKIYVAGPQEVTDCLQRMYYPQGARAFDCRFMGQDVYLKPFTFIQCKPEEAPPAKNTDKTIGRHLEGCRIGFDLGASDLKISAVVEGNVVYSEEIIWQPRHQVSHSTTMIISPRRLEWMPKKCRAWMPSAAVRPGS